MPFSKHLYFITWDVITCTHVYSFAYLATYVAYNVGRRGVFKYVDTFCKLCLQPLKM